MSEQITVTVAVPHSVKSVNYYGICGIPQLVHKHVHIYITDDLVYKAEILGSEGKVEEAQGVMKLCDQLKKERYHLENLDSTKQDQITAQAKQMEVCPVCGAFLIVGDAESRQREHLLGKQHMGYAQVTVLTGIIY